MFISRKLAMGKRAQAEGDPPGHPPPLAGDHAKKPFSSVTISQAGKKGLIFSKGSSHDHDQNYRDMGPQVSMNKQTELSFLQNHCWGGGSYCGDCGCSTPGLGLGFGESSPSPSVSSRQLCPRGWIQRGFNTAPSTFSL